MDVKAVRKLNSQREKDRVKGTGDSQSMLANLSQINLLSAISCLTLTHIFIHRSMCFLHNNRHRHGWVTFTFKEPLFSKRERVRDELHRKVTPTRLWCKDWEKKNDHSAIQESWWRGVGDINYNMSTLHSSVLCALPVEHWGGGATVWASQCLKKTRETRTREN